MTAADYLDLAARVIGMAVTMCVASRAWQRWVDSWAYVHVRDAAYQGKVGFPILYVALHGGGGFGIALASFGLWAAI